MIKIPLQPSVTMRIYRTLKNSVSMVHNYCYCSFRLQQLKMAAFDILGYKAEKQKKENTSS